MITKEMFDELIAEIKQLHKEVKQTYDRFKRQISNKQDTSRSLRDIEKRLDVIGAKIVQYDHRQFDAEKKGTKRKSEKAPESLDLKRVRTAVAFYPGTKTIDVKHTVKRLLKRLNKYASVLAEHWDSEKTLKERQAFEEKRFKKSGIYKAIDDYLIVKPDMPVETQVDFWVGQTDE